MKTLEIVVKNVMKAREVAENAGVDIVSEKLITVCTLMVIKGDISSLIDFNDEFFAEVTPALHAQYLKDIMN